MPWTSLEKRNGRLSRGFTLLELIVTMTVAAIVMVLAVPAFDTLIARNTKAAIINSLRSSIYIGRSEAIKRNQSVTICPTENNLDCSADWNRGWMVFIDADRDGQMTGGSTDLIRTETPPVGTPQITWTFKANYLQFTPSGGLRAKLGDSVEPSGQFDIIDADNAEKTSMIVARNGIITMLTKKY